MIGPIDLRPRPEGGHEVYLIERCLFASFVAIAQLTFYRKAVANSIFLSIFVFRRVTLTGMHDESNKPC